MTRVGRSPGPAVMHLDAAWAALASGVPTVNGYSGAAPPAWEPLHDGRIRTPAEAAALEAALAEWLEANGAEAAAVQSIRLPSGYRGGRSGVVNPGRRPAGRRQ